MDSPGQTTVEANGIRPGALTRGDADDPPVLRHCRNTPTAGNGDWTGRDG
ncbi:MAG: hypothetical protein IT199_05210 [Solirubrobacterales bacterium]|nr:hypothetical protein [Solirubrobacterales bacterium]